MRCLVKIDTNLSFLDHFIVIGRYFTSKRTDIIPVLDDSLRCVHGDINPEKLPGIVYVSTVTLNVYSPSYELLLKYLKNRIHPNAFKVQFPAVADAKHLPSGKPCTLLSAMCLQTDKDMTAYIRLFLVAFADEIDVQANELS